MADKQEAQPTQPSQPQSSGAKQATGDVEQRVQDANAKGYIGEVPDPIPNEEYSLESGPDSPSAVPDHATRYAPEQGTTK